LIKDRIDRDTPPAFLVHAGNDDRVPVEESIDLYLSLRRKGVPAELHVYEQGSHGFALETNRSEAITGIVKSWSERCIEWLKVRGIMN
jgi:dipeptidyl aminopeptidase/acylaminoacyl peptidase